MTEQEWLSCDDTRQMFRFLEDRGLTDRKWWLIYFNHEILDLTFGNPTEDVEEIRARHLIRRKAEVGFLLADGLASAKEVWQARHPDNPKGGDLRFDTAISHVRREFVVDQRSWIPGAAGVMVRRVRDIVGNPFRPVTLPPGPPCGVCGGLGQAAAHCEDCGRWGHFGKGPCSWLTPEVVSLARAAYDERNEDGTLDADRLAVLSDALEEAGCRDYRILEHLRDAGGWEYRGHGNMERNDVVHFRGCWAVDLLLGKE